MYVTGARYTDFFIYTTKGHHTERIHYDHSFTRAAVHKAIKGFRAFVIPEYFEQRGPRILLMCIEILLLDNGVRGST